MAKEIEQSLSDYSRGIVGGLLFSLPLLYTMEVWWAGFVAGPGRLLVLLVATFVLLLGYNHFAGLRRDTEVLETAGEAVEEIGLGILLAALVLWLTGRIGAGMGFREVLGKTLVESALVAIGVSVGKAQLGSGDRRRGQRQASERDRPFGLVGHVVMGACGAMLVAGNVAPTEEVVVIAAESGSGKLLALLALSLVMTAAVLYHADLRGADRKVGRPGGVGEVLAGTAVMYGVALVVSAAALWFFGRFAGVSPAMGVGLAVVLAFPGSLGASAGRVLLQE